MELEGGRPSGELAHHCLCRNLHVGGVDGPEGVDTLPAACGDGLSFNANRGALLLAVAHFTASASVSSLNLEVRSVSQAGLAPLPASSQVGTRRLRKPSG